MGVSLLIDLVWCLFTGNDVGRRLHSLLHGGCSLGEVVLDFAFESNREAELLVVRIPQVVQVLHLLNIFLIKPFYLLFEVLPGFFFNLTEEVISIFM